MTTLRRKPLPFDHIRPVELLPRHRGREAVLGVISPLRDRFAIDVEDGDDTTAKGNVVDHDYKIERGGNQVAEVSKSLIEVAPVAPAIFGKTYARTSVRRLPWVGFRVGVIGELR